MLATVLEAAVIAFSVSIDAFVASFAYGSQKIKIPFWSNQIVNVICSFILGVSLLAGAIVGRYLPGWLTVAACFAILFILGVTKLLDSATKSIIRKHYRSNGHDLSKEIKFTMLNFNFILNLYADPEVADVDENKIISPSEAAALAVSLSLDGMAIGFGAGVGKINILAVLLTSFVINMLAVFIGCRLGNKLSRKLPFNLSWLSGAILICLAIIKLF